MSDSTEHKAMPPPFDPHKHTVKTKGGKVYLPVAERLRWALADQEAGGYEITIAMEVVHFDADRAAVRATVTIPGRGTASNVKSEVRPGVGGQVGFASYLEKAATGAIGRCLALLGYGTDMALELWDEDMQEGGEISAAVDTPRAQSTGATVSTAAGGATLVQRAGAALQKAVSTPGAQERKDQANAQIKRLVREHGYAPPATYGALVKLAAEQYGYTLPKVASAQQIAPEVLEKFVAHITKVGGDPAQENKEHAEEQPSPFEQAPQDGDEPARLERYQRALADFRRALEAYSVVAELDDVIALVRQLHAEGCLRLEDRQELEELHAQRVRVLSQRAVRGA